MKSPISMERQYMNAKANDPYKNLTKEGEARVRSALDVAMSRSSQPVEVEIEPTVVSTLEPKTDQVRVYSPDVEMDLDAQAKADREAEAVAKRELFAGVMPDITPPPVVIAGEGVDLDRSLITGMHVGRRWSGTELEDECPCHQAECGLVDQPDPECEQHHMNKTMRQIHSAEGCPGRRTNIVEREDEQPDPVANDEPSAHDIAIASLTERKEFGLKKYGTLLQVGNGRNSIKDAYEEAQDLVVYLATAQEEQRRLLEKEWDAGLAAGIRWALDGLPDSWARELDEAAHTMPDNPHTI
ncbi:hypothetical protein KHQ84_gp157 [Rhodococcus phage Finch]|uniref:Uncharacterized protein n=1 Tax=Rhodococcus phage Finch TaxID=2094144 RepID=A0A2P1JXR7_9CAUD|nr:hypothetical protein KHQ84_gp157 [Rhodococcus phage Finch]AVO25157.1 hypothetical protein SEA_FINCH_157 [Rhodococcus phage Finch]